MLETRLFDSPNESVIAELHAIQARVFEHPFALEKIRERAYELFVERGCQHGHDLGDWMRAEKEISNAGAEKSLTKQ